MYPSSYPLPPLPFRTKTYKMYQNFFLYNHFPILPWNHSFDSFFHNVSPGLEGANVCAIIYNENTFLESQASLIYLNFLPWCLLFS